MFFYQDFRSYERKSHLTQLVCALATTGPHTSLDPREIVDLAGEFLHEIETYDREASRAADEERVTETNRVQAACKAVNKKIREHEEMVTLRSLRDSATQMISGINEQLRGLRDKAFNTKLSKTVREGYHDQVKELTDKANILSAEKGKLLRKIEELRVSLRNKYCAEAKIQISDFYWEGE